MKGKSGEERKMAKLISYEKKLNLDDKIYQPKLVKTVISNAKNKMQDAYNYATFARDYYTQKISDIYYEYEKFTRGGEALRKT